jgi:Ca2+-transporting ATPase
LAKSVIQGLAIFAASFGTYLYYNYLYPDHAVLSRTMGLTIILLSNLFLVQVNSSNYQFAFQSFLKLIKDKVMWMVNIATILGLIIMLYTPLNGFLKLAPLNANEMMFAIFMAFIAVFWYELVKVGKHLRKFSKRR